MKVLAVDDEPKIREVISDFLSYKGIAVFPAENGRDALDIFEREQIDFVILDLMLPDISGEEVCRKIRKQSDVPIVMLSAKSHESDLLCGLGIGADDYIRKPFSLKELYARMEVIMRRVGLMNNSIRIDSLVIDLRQMMVQRDGCEVLLTASEWKILEALVRHAGTVLSRAQLIEMAFGLEFEAYDRAIDTHIKNLRKKIENDPHNPKLIRTVHGLGYRFEVVE